MRRRVIRSMLMKTTLLSMAIAAGLSHSQLAGAQDVSANGGTEKPRANEAQAAEDASKSASSDAEAKFKALLTNATLTGRWCSIEDGRLGPDREDKYTILSVAKIASDLWLVNARIQYSNKDLIAPIPVRVKWAGDTPVIVVDNVGIPGGATYSARVLFHANTYSGTWTGGSHGGLLHGVITNDGD